MSTPEYALSSSAETDAGRVARRFSCLWAVASSSPHGNHEAAPLWTARRDVDAAKRLIDLYESRIARHRKASFDAHVEIARLTEFVRCAEDGIREHHRVVTTRWKLRGELRRLRARARSLEAPTARARIALLRWVPLLKADRLAAAAAIRRQTELAVRFEPLTGIYFLLDGQEIVYVGQSVDCNQRIAQHRRDARIRFDKACAIPTRKSDLDERERLFIELLRPAKNITFNRT